MPAHPFRARERDAADNAKGDCQLAVPSVSHVGTGYVAPPERESSHKSRSSLATTSFAET
jgi:hypothetical protein